MSKKLSPFAKWLQNLRWFLSFAEYPHSKITFHLWLNLRGLEALCRGSNFLVKGRQLEWLPVCFTVYSEPSLQWQNLFLKMLPLKWICCCKESLMDRMICKKDLVLFLFPHRTYVLEEAILTNIQNKCFFKVLNTIFLHKLWLTVTS